MQENTKTSKLTNLRLKGNSTNSSQIQVFSSAVLLFLTVDVALFSHKKIIGLWRNFFTLANESFLKTPDEPSAMLTKRWDTELSGRELVSIKFLKIKKDISVWKVL